MSAFATYLLGYLIFVIGLAVAAYLLNVPVAWIIGAAALLFGGGVLAGTRIGKRNAARAEARAIAGAGENEKGK
jgi:hypothetical protein